MIWLGLLLILILGCSPSSQEELRSEGEEVCRAFIQELQKIHTKEEALKHYSSIEKKYRKIASLMADLREMQEWEGESEVDRNSELSNKLFLELARLYEIPGIREILEKAQLDGINKSRITR
ncbi:MAG TPA: hypothetical protein VLG44_04195 [Chlamydiales bacterium]|nr:hypothetical protein [Chlamydiales bacterium]